MSVPKYKRGNNKFELLNKTKDLANYLIRIMSNEKKMSPKYYYIIGKDIIEAAKSIHDLCWAANGISIRKGESASEARKLVYNFSYRESLQVKAILKCNNLFQTLDLGYGLYKIKFKQLHKASEKIEECKKMIIKWRESDRKRYNTYIKELEEEFDDFNHEEVNSFIELEKYIVNKFELIRNDIQSYDYTDIKPKLTQDISKHYSKYGKKANKNNSKNNTNKNTTEDSKKDNANNSENTTNKSSIRRNVNKGNNTKKYNPNSNEAIKERYEQRKKFKKDKSKR